MTARQPHTRKTTPLSSIAALLAALPAFGGWLATEIGILTPHARNGQLGNEWRWSCMNALQVPGWIQVLGAGALVIGITWLIHVTAGRVVSRRPRLLSRQPFISIIAAPAWALTFAWVSTVMMQRGSGVWSTAAMLTIMAAGRLCVLCMLWDAARLAQVFGPWLRSRRGGTSVAIVVVALMTLPFLRHVEFGPCGDEPSYIHYSASIAQDFDLRFPPDEVEQMTRLMGVPREFSPHLWPFKEPNPPLHFIGFSIVMVPVFVVGQALGAVVASFRAFAILLHAISMILAYLLAARILCWRGAALAGTLLVFASFPLLGMTFQVYPEVTVTPLVMVAYLAMVPALVRSRKLLLQEIVVICIVCTLLPWFHSKFALTSIVLFATLALANWPWPMRHAGSAFGIVFAGAAAFLGFHLPVFGSMLWKQSRVVPNLYGILGQVTSSDIGMLAYAPWLVLLPFGMAAMRKRGIPWRTPVALLAPATLMFLLSANTENWASGGDIPLRFYAPFAPLLVPVVGAAIARIPRHRLAGVVLLAVVPVAAAMMYYRFPELALPAQRQSGRMVLDRALIGLSWREFFPAFAYPLLPPFMQGVDAPMNRPHAAVVIGAFALLSVIILLKPARRVHPALLGTCLVLILATAARVFESPNWTVTAANTFRRQAHMLRRMERYNPPELNRWKNLPALLDLPAALKPLESVAPERLVSAKYGLMLKSDWPDGLYSAGPHLPLPGGRYRTKVYGLVHSNEPVSGSLHLSAQELFVYWRELATAHKEIRPIPGTWQPVELELSFKSKGGRRRIYDIQVAKSGKFDLLLERLQLKYTLDDQITSPPNQRK